MIRALLFDLDGTLASTEEANSLAYAHAFQQVGVQFTPDAYRSVFGLRFDEMVARIAPQLSAEQRAKVQADKAGHYSEHLELIRPNAGLIALLHASRSHLRTALVTTAAGRNAKSVLEYLSLADGAFDVTVFGEDVARGKPDPMAYRVAMERLSVQPAECVIFEDSDVGVQAATASGAQVVRVVCP